MSEEKNGKELTRVDKARELAFDHNLGGLQLRNFEEVLSYAKAMIDSRLAPKGFDTPGAIVFAMQRGSELGLPPAAALSSFYVSPGGRPALYAEAALAVLRGKEVLEPSDTKAFVGAGMDLTCVWTFRRRGWAPDRWETSKFSLGEAARAGLMKKDSNWEKWPLRMLWARAVAFACKDWFSDVLLGIDVIDPSESEEREPGGPAPSPPPTVPGATSSGQAPPEGDPLIDDIVDAEVKEASPSPSPAESDEDRWEILKAEIGRRTEGDGQAERELLREIGQVYDMHGIEEAERELIDHPVWGGALQRPID